MRTRDSRSVPFYRPTGGSPHASTPKEFENGVEPVGEVVVTVDCDFLELTKDQRTFVYALVDLLDQWGHDHSMRPPSPQQAQNRQQAQKPPAPPPKRRPAPKRKPKPHA